MTKTFLGVQNNVRYLTEAEIHNLFSISTMSVNLRSSNETNNENDNDNAHRCRQIRPRPRPVPTYSYRKICTEGRIAFFDGWSNENIDMDDDDGDEVCEGNYDNGKCMLSDEDNVRGNRLRNEDIPKRVERLASEILRDATKSAAADAVYDMECRRVAMRASVMCSAPFDFMDRWKMLFGKILRRRVERWEMLRDGGGYDDDDDNDSDGDDGTELFRNLQILGWIPEPLSRPLASVRLKIDLLLINFFVFLSICLFCLRFIFLINRISFYFIYFLFYLCGGIGL